MQSNDAAPDFVGDEPMITAREVGRMLGLCTAQIHKMALRGQLPSYRFGHARRFLRSEVLEAIKQFKEGGHRPPARTITRRQAKAYRAPYTFEQPKPRTRKK